MVSSAAAILVIEVSIPIFVAAFILYIVRSVKGPTIFDTVLAVDALCFDVVAFMAILAIYFRSYLLLAAPILLSLWAYILDVLIARHFLRGGGGAGP